MADADSSLTDTSLSPSASTTHTSLLDSAPGAQRPPDRTSRPDRRASLGLIDAARMRLTVDFNTLLRSNSRSQPVPPVLSTQAEDPENEHLVYPNDDKVSSHSVDLEVRSMDGTPEARQGRGLGARIVNFLNRSRSRSQSKKRRSRSLDAFPADPMPNTVHTASLRVHARHSSLEHDGDGNVAGPSRPTTRSPSRPLSNTTTTTNTTVKPRSRKAPEHIAVPAPPPVSSATAEIVAQVVPMESGKSNPSRKGKRMNLFGILLPSPRKGSFGESFRGRSRPTTPSQSIPSTPAAAPEPMWPGRDDRPWTDKSGSQRSQKSIRKGLPVHVEEPPLPYLTSSTSREAERGGAFSGLVSSQVRDTPVHILNSPPRHRDPYGTSEDDPDVEVRTLEGRCSPFCGFGTSSKGSHTSQEKGKEKERARGSRDRSGERERERREREREREREKERITHPRRVGSPLQRMRESTSAVAVSAVPMEKTSSGRSANSKRSASRDHHGPPRAGVDNLATRTNRTKHGSFDFERPVSAGTGAGGGMSIRTALRSMGIGEPERQPLQRSSSARAVPMRKLPNDSGVGFEPSSLPSSRPLAEKGKKPARDVQFASRAARRPTFDGSVSTPAHHGHSSSHYPSRPNGTNHHHTQSHHGHHSTPPQHAHHSTQSQSHNTQHRRDAVPASPLSSASGDSSGHTRDGSWGRSAAKRTPSARTSHAHGLFKFEPAVPPIPGSPADDRRGAPRAVSRPTSPSPLPAPEAGMSKSSQARLAGRGRSLDLGLGLTWAPSRVREDALLRVGPRSGTSMSTSGATRARSRWRGADEDGRLTVGVASDVAEAFKEALGDSAYAIFKNYVHRFDANAIPLDGPYGLLVHVERLLDNAPGVDYRRKRILLERFARVVRDSDAAR